MLALQGTGRLQVGTLYVITGRTNGTYLAQRYELGSSINLYHLYTFFCEAWVCQERAEIVRLCPFNCWQPLLTYAELVQLPAFKTHPTRQDLRLVKP
ncbi:hypothetical protein [Hymenobacter radiodurans]|uniref:hypothetical protein n=1 Tax=Hymenobacter radiodurans TaxID=2496028 RepID=UPI00105893DE|nr:hypothetical protein [Hymenobacter radiodurans]